MKLMEVAIVEVPPLHRQVLPKSHEGNAISSRDVGLASPCW
jgi:hypothetical protein